MSHDSLAQSVEEDSVHVGRLPWNEVLEPDQNA